VKQSYNNCGLDLVEFVLDLAESRLDLRHEIWMNSSRVWMKSSRRVKKVYSINPSMEDIKQRDGI
jgi:hypothetical protein